MTVDIRDPLLDEVLLQESVREKKNVSLEWKSAPAPAKPRGASLLTLRGLKSQLEEQKSMYEGQLHEKEKGLKMQTEEIRRLNARLAVANQKQSEGGQLQQSLVKAFSLSSSLSADGIVKALASLEEASGSAAREKLRLVEEKLKSTEQKLHTRTQDASREQALALDFKNQLAAEKASKVSLSNELREELENRLDATQKEIIIKSQQTQRLKEQIHTAERDLVQRTRHVEELNKIITKLKRDLKASSSGEDKEKYDELLSTYSNTSKMVARLRKEVSTLKAENEGLRAKGSQGDEQRLEREKLHSDLQRLTAQLRQRESTIADRDRIITEQQANWKKDQEAHTATKAMLQDLEQKAKAAKERDRAFQGMKKMLSGLQKEIQSKVLEIKTKDSETEQALAEAAKAKQASKKASLEVEALKEEQDKLRREAKEKENAMATEDKEEAGGSTEGKDKEEAGGSTEGSGSEIVQLQKRIAELEKEAAKKESKKSIAMRTKKIKSENAELKRMVKLLQQQLRDEKDQQRVVELAAENETLEKKIVTFAEEQERQTTALGTAAEETAALRLQLSELEAQHAECLDARKKLEDALVEATTVLPQAEAVESAPPRAPVARPRRSSSKKGTKRKRNTEEVPVVTASEGSTKASAQNDEAEEPARKKPRRRSAVDLNDGKETKVMITGINPDEKGGLSKLSSLFGFQTSMATKLFEKDVTHLIVPPNKYNAKVYAAALTGKWIVDPEWLYSKQPKGVIGNAIRQADRPSPNAKEYGSQYFNPFDEGCSMGYSKPLGEALKGKHIPGFSLGDMNSLIQRCAGLELLKAAEDHPNAHYFVIMDEEEREQYRNSHVLTWTEFLELILSQPKDP